jgi:hypothetical protein
VRRSKTGGQARGEAIGFQDFHAHQLPLGDGGLVNEVLLGLVLGLVEVLEAVVDVVEVLLTFAGQDDFAGAQAVAQRIHGGGGLPLRSLRTGCVPCVAAICRDLSLCCHTVTSLCQAKPIGGRGSVRKARALLAKAGLRACPTRGREVFLATR